MRSWKLSLWIVILIGAAPLWAKTGFIGNITEMTIENKNFRNVIYTAKKLQLVLMTLKSGEDIGEETHKDTDQFFRFEKGKGEVMIDGKKTSIKENDAVLIPAGSKHNVTNTGSGLLQFYTLYGPPTHKDKTVKETKNLADISKGKEKFDGKTSE